MTELHLELQLSLFTVKSESQVCHLGVSPTLYRDRQYVSWYIFVIHWIAGAETHNPGQRYLVHFH